MKKIKKIIIFILVLLGLTSIITLLNNGSDNLNVNTNITSSLVNNVNSKGIAILKKVSDEISSDGYPCEIYSYEVTGVNNSLTSIKVKSIEYTNASDDDIDINKVLDVKIDSKSSTFTIEKLKEFDNQICLTLCLTSDESISSSLLIDYKQRWLGFNLNVNKGVAKELGSSLYPTYLDINDFISSFFYRIADNYSNKYTIPLDYIERVKFDDCLVNFNAVNTVASFGYYSNGFQEIRPVSILENGSNNLKESINILLSGEQLFLFDLVDDLYQEYLNTQDNYKNQALEANTLGFKYTLNVSFVLNNISTNLDVDIICYTSLNNVIDFSDLNIL